MFYLYDMFYKKLNFIFTLFSQATNEWRQYYVHQSALTFGKCARTPNEKSSKVRGCGDDFNHGNVQDPEFLFGSTN